MPNDKRTMAQLAQEVLDVQGACNLSGVVLSWGRSIARLRVLLEEAGEGGTDAINGHPINKLWADKVAHLTGLHLSEASLGEYDETSKLAKG